MRTLAVCGTFVVITALSTPTFATLISDNTPQDNQLGARDSVSPAPTIYRNNGTSTVMTVGGVSTNNDYAAVIIRWALAAVPAGEVAIADATLTLTRSSSGSPTINLDGTQIFEVYKIKSSNAGWGEGTGNVAGSNPVTALAGGSTWSHLAYSTTLWDGGPGLGTQGTGGYEGEISGSATPLATFTFNNGGSSNGGPSAVNVTIPMSVINDWIANPAGNAGIYIKLQSGQLASTEHSLVFRTRNAGTATAPTLTFETAVVPEPTSIVLTILAGFGVTLVVHRCRGSRHH